MRQKMEVKKKKKKRKTIWIDANQGVRVSSKLFISNLRVIKHTITSMKQE